MEAHLSNVCQDLSCMENFPTFHGLSVKAREPDTGNVHAGGRNVIAQAQGVERMWVEKESGEACHQNKLSALSVFFMAQITTESRPI